VLYAPRLAGGTVLTLLTNMTVAHMCTQHLMWIEKCMYTIQVKCFKHDAAASHNAEAKTTHADALLSQHNTPADCSHNMLKQTEPPREVPTAAAHALLPRKH
jgi:hypothetical protein